MNSVSVKVMNRRAGLYRKSHVAVAARVTVQQLQHHINRGQIPGPSHLAPWSDTLFYSEADKKLIVEFFNRRRLD